MISEHQNRGQITLKMTTEMVALFKFTSNQKNSAGQGTTSCASVPWCPNEINIDQLNIPAWVLSSVSSLFVICLGLIEVWINNWGVALQSDEMDFKTCDTFWQVTLPMSCRGAPDAPDMSKITAGSGWLWTTPSSTWVDMTWIANLHQIYTSKSQNPSAEDDTNTTDTMYSSTMNTKQCEILKKHALKCNEVPSLPYIHSRSRWDLLSLFDSSQGAARETKLIPTSTLQSLPFAWQEFHECLPMWSNKLVKGCATVHWHWPCIGQHSSLQQSLKATLQNNK